MLYPEEDLISNLPNYTFKRIEHALNRDCAWKKIVDILPIFDLMELESTQSPGDAIMCDFINKACTVKNLAKVLKLCELHAALSIIYNEPIKIIQQPLDDRYNNKKLVQRGTPLTLDFIVYGVPLPKYYWYRNAQLLADQCTNMLQYMEYSPELEGQYYCIAVQTLENGQTKCLKSNAVQIETMPERCVIIKRPPAEIVKIENQSVNLTICALGYPPPKFEWMHINKVLKNQTENSLQILCTKERQGNYTCRVWNCANEVSVTTKITVTEAGALYKCVKTPAVKKVAFLVGNQNYKNQNPLLTAINDVDKLECILNSMNFIVYKLTDATLEDMKAVLKSFCRELVEDSYVLFYFAGHGFEFGEKYLLPVDSPDPNNYRYKDAVSEYLILKEVLDTAPKFFLLILDMCLAFPDRFENSKIYNEPKEEVHEYRCNRNLIQCYSTTSGQSAYEEKGKAHSLFFSVFKKYVKGNLSVLQILAKTSQEFERQHVAVEQQPCITLNVTKDFYLNGPLMST